MFRISVSCYSQQKRSLTVLLYLFNVIAGCTTTSNQL
jgi:hypothetical protein